MYSEVIKYTDFNGDEVSERFYFNISKTELQKQNMYKKGGLLNYLTRIITSRDQAEIAKYFEEIINMSYGIKSDDGKRFIKSEEITKDFMCSAAYDELFFRLTTDEEYASKFINAILPTMPEDNTPESKAAQEKLKGELSEFINLDTIKKE